MTEVMIRHLGLTLLAFLVLAAPAAAKAPVVGIGDQHPHMFADPAFKSLGVKHSRLVVAWDWYRDPFTLWQTDQWMAGARAAHVKPLIAFSRNWRRGGERRLPSLARYRKSFRLFRDRYPFVRDFSAWNEANHTSQPTARKPRAAARYFNAMRRDCRKCTIVAADLLDTRDMLRWVAKFKRFAPKARVWGLHNYKDANDATNTTRALLRAVRGQVWLTETGGILRLKSATGGRGRKHTKAHQARAVTRVFNIARANRRVKRIYFYEWKKQPKNRWDSAFLDGNGKRRPAYRALKRGLGRG
jgi:polysaccharide biosynthesis protein PslG